MANQPEKPLPIAIIGGGITGLTAAYRLIAQGHSVRLFEASSRLGGNIRSTREGDWLIEAGPNSLQATPAVSAFLKELGLTPLAAAPAAKNRYIVRDGRPQAAPGSPPAFLKSSLFSAGAKFRLLAEFLKRPRNRQRTANGGAGYSDEDLSLAAFAEEHFGRELVDYALSPFVSGVYAGDPNKLSARLAFPMLWEAERTHGSLIRAQIASARAKRARGEPAGPPPIVSFAEGLEDLPRALAARLPAGSIQLNTRVTAVRSVAVSATATATVTEPAPAASIKSETVWEVAYASSSPDEAGVATERFRSVILALPATALSALSINNTRPLSALSEIEYPPVSALFLGYRRDQVAHPLDGFGMLVPAIEKRSILGVLFNSTLFPRRAPDGHVALTVMTGGALAPELAKLDDAELLARVRVDLEQLLGVRGEPTLMRRAVWPRAIPQYNLGYGRFLDEISATEAAHSGLFIGGHVRNGISLPNCLTAGEKLAARAVNQS